MLGELERLHLRLTTKGRSQIEAQRGERWINAEAAVNIIVQNPDVTRVVLFGSVINGYPIGGSDTDLAVFIDIPRLNSEAYHTNWNRFSEQLEAAGFPVCFHKQRGKTHLFLFEECAWGSLRMRDTEDILFSIGAGHILYLRKK